MKASEIFLFYILTLHNSLNIVAHHRCRHNDNSDSDESGCTYSSDYKTVDVKVFYNHHSDKTGSTRHVINTICNESPKFGAKMTDTGNGPECDSSEDCSEELREMCTYLQTKEEKELICCMYKSKNPAVECYPKYGITEEKISVCEEKGYNSDAGRRLLESRNNLKNAEMSEGPLPAFLFNNGEYGYSEFNTELTYTSTSNFGIFQINTGLGYSFHVHADNIYLNTIKKNECVMGHAIEVKTSLHLYKNYEVYSECVDQMAYDDFLWMVCNIYGIYEPVPPC